MSGNFKMDDYVPVNERIDAFYKAYPEGSIQSEVIELTETRVSVKAYAYRKHDDPRPGVGHSSLNIPGSTPYTRGSELENAETSAWGRAIAALGFEVKRGIATAEEVRNKTPEAARAPATRPARVAPQRALPAETGPDGDYEASPFDDVVVDPLSGEAIAAATGGTALPDKPPYVVKAEQKAAARTPDECPEHGSERIKQNRRGLYCATNMGTRDDPEWCPWSKAKAA